MLQLGRPGKLLQSNFPHRWLAKVCLILLKREFQDVLNAGQVFPVVHKATVVLKTTIDATVELDDQVCIQCRPGPFGCRLSCPCAETSLAQSFEQFVQRGFHDGGPSRTSTLERLSIAPDVPAPRAFAAGGQSPAQTRTLQRWSRCSQ